MLYNKLLTLKIGSKVWCSGDSNFCNSSIEIVEKITYKYDKDTGERYPVIWLKGDRKFDARDGLALNSPFAYYIKVL